MLLTLSFDLDGEKRDLANVSAEGEFTVSLYGHDNQVRKIKYIKK